MLSIEIASFLGSTKCCVSNYNMMNSRLAILFLSALATLSIGCASQTQLPRAVRVAIEEQYENHVVELRQSVYYGDLYDENEQWLMSPHPFESTFHIVDLDGNPIHPKNQVGIIPAGSKLIIDKVEFPDTFAIATRMITTPRFNPWVYLRPVPNSPLALENKNDKPFIFPLPLHLDTEDEVHQAIRELLAEGGSMTQWLAQRRPTVQAAIAHKEIISGMTQEELFAAAGKPHRWISEFNSQPNSESNSEDRKTTKTMVAWYPSQEAWISNQRVVTVRPSRVLAISANDPELQN